LTDHVRRNWMSGKKPRRRKRGFEIQEERAAAAHPGGKMTRGSGCSQRPGRKGDSVGSYFRQSAKTTEKPGAKSIRIQRSWLDEIRRQAKATGHEPMLVFGFAADDQHRETEDWAAFPLELVEDMTKALAAVLEGDISKAQRHAEMALGEPRE